MTAVPARTTAPTGARPFAWARRLLASATEPHPAIERVADRRQAQLLSAVLLLFTPLVAVTVVLAPTLVRPEVPLAQEPMFQVGMGVCATFLLTYVLSRSRHWMPAAYVLVGASVLTVWALVWRSAGTPWLAPAPLFLLFSTLLSSLFLGPWRTAAVAILDVLSVLAYGGAPGLDEGTFTSHIIILAIFPPLVVLASFLRQRNLENLESLLQERELEKSRFAALVDSTPDAIVIVDRAGRITFANKQAEALFGYTQAELVGQVVEVLVPQRHRSHHPRQRATYVEAPRARPMGAGMDLSAVRKDGTEFPVEISLSPWRTTDGDFVISVVRDITERKQSEGARRLAEEKEQEVQRLREMNAFKTRILNTASHELNTPLTPIKMELHMLRTMDAERLSPRQRHALEVLDRNLRRLADLVQDVLDVARLESDRLRVRPAVVEIGDAIRQVVESYPPGTGAPIAVQSSGGAVRADPGRLQQVLLNLVANARKFTPPGGAITVRSGREGGHVVVEVADTGIGIAPEKQALLFQPFSQVHDMMQVTAPGTGLGLYIARGIVEAHGGSIGVRSDGLGRGSTFWVRWPAADVAGPGDGKPGD